MVLQSRSLHRDWGVRILESISRHVFATEGGGGRGYESPFFGARRGGVLALRAHRNWHTRTPINYFNIILMFTPQEKALERALFWERLIPALPLFEPLLIDHATD